MGVQFSQDAPYKSHNLTEKMKEDFWEYNSWILAEVAIDTFVKSISSSLQTRYKTSFTDYESE